MPDKKLTDSEITIKALKEILELMLCEGDLQRTSTISHAIDLINRQEEKIAEKERIIGLAEKAVVSMKKEIEKLVAEKHIAKAEAYKECIEKVKENSNKMELVCSGALVRTDYTITKENLDNLLNELVGDRSGES